MTRLAVGLLTVHAGLCAPEAAHAAAKTASISVSAEVVDTCNIAVSGVIRAGAANCSFATPYRIVTTSAATDAGTAPGVNGNTEVSTAQHTLQKTDGRALVMTIIF